LDITGEIFNIQRFSIHDGPGIRTTVFFKGCTLRCFWCHNPEGLRPGVEISFYPERCITCGECVRACPEGAQQINDGMRTYDRARCTACGACLDSCFTGALEKTGQRLSLEQVMAEILPDRAFYQQSGGGVTLSGGDPLLQHDFAAALLRACKQEGLHTAVETTANCRWDVMASILPDIDLVMMDIKHMDPQRHRGCTGVTNERILANAARLVEEGKPVLFRTPVVPGVNDTPQEIAAIAAFIAEIGARAGAAELPRLELLPFHQLAASKYHSLGMEYQPHALIPPDREKMQALGAAAAAQGIPVTVR
jgi:pyruvate formate lyase activating enzyme